MSARATYVIRRRRSWAGGALLLGLLACSDHAAPVPPLPEPRASDIAAAIRAHLAAGVGPALRLLTPAEQAQVRWLYETSEHGPLWTDAAGRPSGSAREALNLLSGAAADGLEPADYAAVRLVQLLSRLSTAQTPRLDDWAALDVGLSAGMLRYLRDLHMGRIDPRTIGFRLAVPADRHDVAQLLRSALRDRRITQTASELAPRLAQYQGLLTMLSRYRSLAAATDPGARLPPGTVRPGEHYAGLQQLQRRLLALGDLPPDTPAPGESGLYAGALVQAIRRFQRRHGLDQDGVIGSATLAALNVPLSWRVRQIELALERLRWLPDPGDERIIALNIPMFYFWAWDLVPPTGEPILAMRAIVGRALGTQTPVFSEEMRSVIFRPYWNVPRSILRNEVLPILARDPDYLHRHDMEVVGGQGDDAHPVPLTTESLALLRQGALRLRQRPGPRNALGLVKFVFPNDENVYLHGTPQQELFSRARRDFSHGCVRVEDPVTLAEWALKEEPGWNRERILTAMRGPRPQTVNLTRPIQVLLFYITAVVMPEDGTIHFAEDIYGHDSRLDRALARQRPRP